MKLEINETDVWETLKKSEKPVVVYGMGNAAERIIKILDENGISVADIFASDEFVRGHSFLGYKVLKYSEVCEKYDDFNVVLAFATHIKEVLDRIENINKEHTVFAPDIPVAGGGLFTREYFEKNRKRFENIYNLLADEESKRVYQNVISFKISGKVDYLYKCNEYAKNKIYSEILKLTDNETIVDAGAYDGDTIREFTGFTGGKYNKIYALEPDAKNFKKLTRNTEGMQGVELYNMGAWNKKDTLIFEGKAGRNSKLSSSGTPVAVSDIDSIVKEKVTLIKMDIEGAEIEAIKGARRILARYKPRLAISVYHKPEDIIDIPLLLWEIVPEYQFCLRHYRSSRREIILYAF